VGIKLIPKQFYREKFSEIRECFLASESCFIAFCQLILIRILVGKSTENIPQLFGNFE